MSCEDCKEQVFELIEREAVDPEGVRAILADCPDCRAEFDAMKAVLALARELPVEEPAADIDAAILRLADRRLRSAVPESSSGAAGEATRIPLYKKMAQVPPWAMAAVALLAVGVGVWSIPRTVQFESDAEQPMLEAKETVPMAEAPREERFAGEPASEEASVVAMDDIADDAPVGVMESAKSGGRPARRQAPRAKKRSDAIAKRSAPDAEAQNRTLAPAAAPSVAKEEGVVQRSAAGGAVAEDSGLASAELDDEDGKRDETSACRDKVTVFERRLRDDEGYAPAPEEQLAIGHCYQRLGATAKARTWLERAAGHPATEGRARKALQALPRK
jgi:negative regulator of sigma E activity